jgi:hypothetical protein
MGQGCVGIMRFKGEVGVVQEYDYLFAP